MAEAKADNTGMNALIRQQATGGAIGTSEKTVKDAVNQEAIDKGQGAVLDSLRAADNLGISDDVTKVLSTVAASAKLDPAALFSLALRKSNIIEILNGLAE